MTRNRRTALKQINRENILKVLRFDQQTNNVQINIKIQQQLYAVAVYSFLFRETQYQKYVNQHGVFMVYSFRSKFRTTLSHRSSVEDFKQTISFLSPTYPSFLILGIKGSGGWDTPINKTPRIPGRKSKQRERQVSTIDLSM